MLLVLVLELPVQASFVAPHRTEHFLEAFSPDFRYAAANPLREGRFHRRGPHLLGAVFDGQGPLRHLRRT
jgi:hypothetical protein